MRLMNLAVVFSLLILLFTGCAPVSQPAAPAAGVAALPTVLPTPVSTPTLQPTASIEPNAIIPTRISTPLDIHSPLAGMTHADLQAAVVNPFNPPPAGSDDPHQGVDLAVVVNGIALQGQPVQAVLSGTAAGIISDRFPYGYALLVETALSDLPLSLQERLKTGVYQPGTAQVSALTCPQVSYPWQANPCTALYILYAHLLEPPTVQAGQAVSGGQIIGSIGASGNALNPHLHIEARIGPAGASFDSMTHYTASASSEEMAAYCTWRISSIFSLVDPMLLLAQTAVE